MTSNNKGDNERVRLSELNHRARAYASQLWQVPFAYIALIGLFLTRSNSYPIEYILVTILVIGFSVLLHMFSVVYHHNKTVCKINHLEKEMEVEEKERASANPGGTVAPFMALVILGIITPVLILLKCPQNCLLFTICIFFIISFIVTRFICNMIGKDKEFNSVLLGSNKSKINQILNILILISVFILTVSYFLPVECLWSPFDAWKGYYDSAGVFNKGFNIGLIEVFPFAVGIITLITLLISKWPKLSMSIILIFSFAWIISLALGVNEVVKDINIKFPYLWSILGVLLIPLALFLIFLSIRKFHKKKTILTLLIILAGASILNQIISIAWYFIEDNLLLNVGSVTGMASACVLFIALLLKRQFNLIPE